jgi:hypothetical protein
MVGAHVMENRRFHQLQRQIDGIRNAPAEFVHDILPVTIPHSLRKNTFTAFAIPNGAPFRSPNQLQAPKAVALCCENLRNSVLVRFQPGRQPDREDRPCQPF